LYRTRHSAALARITTDQRFSALDHDEHDIRKYLMNSPHDRLRDRREVMPLTRSPLHHANHSRPAAYETSPRADALQQHT
jgi:hypothetical protein